MVNTSQTPEYVDTKTRPSAWYAFNLSILILTLGMMAVAAMLLEYEIAKIDNPLVAFLDTPSQLDITLSSLILVLGLANLVVLVFVFLRHLWRRKWMVATTIIGWISIAVMILLLQDKFLKIIFPWWG